MEPSKQSYAGIVEKKGKKPLLQKGATVSCIYYLQEPGQGFILGLRECAGSGVSTMPQSLSTASSYIRSAPALPATPKAASVLRGAKKGAENGSPGLSLLQAGSYASSPQCEHPPKMPSLGDAPCPCHERGLTEERSPHAPATAEIPNPCCAARPCPGCASQEASEQVSFTLISVCSFATKRL